MVDSVAQICIVTGFFRTLAFQKKVEKEDKRYIRQTNKQKNGRTVDFNLSISTITLNINGLNLCNSPLIVSVFASCNLKLCY